jgi:RNA polymerase sigma factor (sigma-70 family)
MFLSDEKTVIFELKKGDIKAFEKIFSFYHKHIYNFCLNLHQSPDDAEETVQKVFVALGEQRARMYENKPLASYLFTIARNIAYQEFRQQVYKKAAFNHFVLNSPYLKETTKSD